MSTETTTETERAEDGTPIARTYRVCYHAPGGGRDEMYVEADSYPARKPGNQTHERWVVFARNGQPVAEVRETTSSSSRRSRPSRSPSRSGRSWSRCARPSRSCPTRKQSPTSRRRWPRPAKRRRRTGGARPDLMPTGRPTPSARSATRRPGRDAPPGRAGSLAGRTATGRCSHPPSPQPSDPPPPVPSQEGAGRARRMRSLKSCTQARSRSTVRERRSSRCQESV